MKRLTLVLGAALVFAACSGGDEVAKNSGRAATREQESVATSFQRLTRSQPVPSFDWSQERQTLIDAETIRATGAKSTAAGYSEYGTMIWWCPSVGAPVPSTYQLSGTSQYVDLPGDETRERFPIDQGEPTGTYVGPSNGTWVICLDDAGKKIGKYWEGPVDVTIGVVRGYPTEKRVVVAESTFTFTEQK